MGRLEDGDTRSGEGEGEGKRGEKGEERDIPLYSMVILMRCQR